MQQQQSYLGKSDGHTSMNLVRAADGAADVVGSCLWWRRKKCYFALNPECCLLTDGGVNVGKLWVSLWWFFTYNGLWFKPGSYFFCNFSSHKLATNNLHQLTRAQLLRNISCENSPVMSKLTSHSHSQEVQTGFNNNPLMTILLAKHCAIRKLLCSFT